MTNDRNFMIFNMSEINKIDFNQVLETSVNTLRLSVDGTQSFIKWEGTTQPTFIEGLTTKQGPYTYAQMLTILNNSTWTDPNDPGAL